MNQDSTSDRRRYRREEQELPVRITPFAGETKSGGPIEGWTVNVGGGGILVDCPRTSPLQGSDEFELAAVPPGCEPDEEHNLGRGRLARFWRHDGVYRAAIEFLSPPATCFEVPSLVGVHPSIRSIKARLHRLCACEYNILVTGQTGTGKNLLARTVHRRLCGPDQPFVRLNCAGIPASLFESLLFGHKRGAFTGAVSSRGGHFQAAAGGTILLDDVAEIPPNVQAKFLRAIEDRTYFPVGSSELKPVECRIIATTNASLPERLAEGSFRRDLYYRLAEIHLRIPPLRERRSGIPLLAAHFLRRYRKELGRPPLQLTPEQMECLRRYDWPGNVRELENRMKRLALFEEWECPSAPIDAEGTSLAGCVREALKRITTSEKTGLKEARRTVCEMVERQAIRQTLQACDGNKSEAARRLRISYRTLLRKVDKYAIEG